MKRKFRVERRGENLVLYVYSVVFEHAENLDDDWIKAWAENYEVLGAEHGLVRVAELLVDLLHTRTPRKRIPGFGYMESIARAERVFISAISGNVVAIADVRLEDASKIVPPSRLGQVYEIVDIRENG